MAVLTMSLSIDVQFLCEKKKGEKEREERVCVCDWFLNNHVEGFRLRPYTRGCSIMQILGVSGRCGNYVWRCRRREKEERKGVETPRHEVQVWGGGGLSLAAVSTPHERTITPRETNQGVTTVTRSLRGVDRHLIAEAELDSLCLPSAQKRAMISRRDLTFSSLNLSWQFPTVWDFI